MYIYKITNLINNRVYIGSTTNFNNRRISHVDALCKNVHNNVYLQKDFNIFGIDSFSFDVIYTFEQPVTKYTLLTKEQEFLNKEDLSNVYNINFNIVDKAGKIKIRSNKTLGKSLCQTILSHKEFDEFYLKQLSTKSYIPMKKILSTINNLINSKHLSFEDGIYTVLKR